VECGLHGTLRERRLQVQIQFGIFWQLDYSRTTRCDRETIAGGRLVGPETPGYLECVGGCTPTRSRVSDVSVRCVAYSQLENWMYGERSERYTPPPSAAQLLTLEYDHQFRRRMGSRHCKNKKHLKNVGPIRHNEPPQTHSADVASGTVARRLRIDIHDIDIDNDNDDDDNDNA